VKLIRSIAVFALVACAGLSAQAQVTNFSIFKVTVYRQSSVAPPTTPDAPNAYYFGAQLNTIDSTDYVDVNFTDPNDNTAYLGEITPFYFNFGSPYFAAKSDFDSSYPSGEYDFFVDYTNLSDTGSLIVPDQDLYTTNIAAFTTNCWIAMQRVDPSVDFTLNWNPFTTVDSATSAYTFVDVLDQDTGNTVFPADFLTPDTTTTNIPANTLLYGKTYRVNTFFSDRQDTPGAGFSGALGTVGFDNLTYTTLVTIPPWLHISIAVTNVVLTWPTLASNFVLECSSGLSATNQWGLVTNDVTSSGGTNWLALPATCPARFFRLDSPQVP
jgi:hypothetical protein